MMRTGRFGKAACACDGRARDDPASAASSWRRVRNPCFMVCLRRRTRGMANGRGAMVDRRALWQACGARSGHIVSKPREIPGARTAQRALRILKLVGAHNAVGLRTPEIVQLLGEERSAVQRALQSLLAEGLVQRRASGRLYELGIEAESLGRAVLRHSPLVARYQFGLQRIARETGETVFLSVRVGDFVLCVHREDGARSVRAPRTRVGDFRVLGTTAGGLALLSTLGDAEVQALFERHAPAFMQAGLDHPELRHRVAQARVNGYGVLSDNVSPGVVSIGTVLRGPGTPFAVAAIAAAKPGMSEPRLQALRRALDSLDGEPLLHDGRPVQADAGPATPARRRSRAGPG
ncbi:MAG: IclR family transcriptional regulator [Comamonadaceae bacterium]|nr:MAG: IclR family transcriptional regulator [Comamonadaceae bacterium]